MGYAVVLGEALVDLFESEADGELVYRPRVGGAPLNVAAGIARLGQAVELATAVSTDALGERIMALLTESGVGTVLCKRVAAPSALAVTSLRDGQPEFQFYGDPPSFSMVAPDPHEREVVAGAAVVYCGSIALLYPASLAAARAAWSVPGPLHAFDPNVRTTLMADPALYRSVVEEFAATADVVKLSEPDAAGLYGRAGEVVAVRLRELGAGAVVLTRGGKGALLFAGGDPTAPPYVVPAPVVSAIDTTGAGDATMAGLIYGLLTAGRPIDAAAWRPIVAFAVAAGSLACEVPGGATAMPGLDAVRAAAR